MSWTPRLPLKSDRFSEYGCRFRSRPSPPPLLPSSETLIALRECYSWLCTIEYSSFIMSDTVDVPEDQASEAILHHIKDAINTYIAYNERLGLPNLALTSVSEQIALRQRPRIIQEAQFLDNCDRHLTDIEAAIEFARGQLITRRSGLHNFLHSPISLLPETVLRYIFALVAADDVQPITYGDSDRMYRSTLLSYAPSVHHISQVCLSWREISTEQRGLWTRITDSMSPDLCDMWLNRSWGAPLTVDLDFRFPLITGNPLRTHFHWALDSRHYDMQDILEQLRERENSDRIQALQIACKLAEPPGPTVAGPLHLHPAAAFHPPMAAAVPPPPAGAALGGAGIGGLNLPTTPWGRLPGLAAPILSGPVAVDVFPLLESLTLVNPGSGGSMGCGVLFTEISSRRFPRLENLILRNVIIGPLPTPLPSLRKLVLDGVCTTWGSLLDLLNGCPSLLSLALVNGGLGPGREGYNGNPVRLPCLLELLFQRTEPAMQFVQNLEMPVLHHLQLVYKRKPELAHVEEYLVRFLHSVYLVIMFTDQIHASSKPPRPSTSSASGRPAAG